MSANYRQMRDLDQPQLGVPTRAHAQSVATQPTRGLEAPTDQQTRTPPLNAAAITKEPGILNNPARLAELQSHPGYRNFQRELEQAAQNGGDDNARHLLTALSAQRQLQGATAMTGTERYAGVTPEQPRTPRQQLPAPMMS